MLISKLKMERFLRLAVILLIFLITLTTFPTAAKTEKIVYHIPIKGTINAGVPQVIARAVDDAEQAKAEAIILEINTFGGRLDAATKVRDSVLDSNILTIAFVNKRAISAGALISLAAKKIVMSPGATIGAATPVDFLGRKASEKVISYWRKEMKSTAEKNDHPPIIAEAMVDEAVKISGLIEEGKLLTLTTKEALRYHVAEYEAEDVGEALKLLGLAKARVVSAPVNEDKQFLKPWILWVVFAAVCVVAEIFTAGFFILWFGVGAAGAGVLAGVGLSIPWQWGAFVIISALCLILSRQFADRITKGRGEKVGPDRLLDKLGIVIEAIDPDTGKGKVRVENEEWRAVSVDGEGVNVGSRVQIIKIEGSHLIVERREK